MRFVFILCAVFLPAMASAQVVITEVMYDLEGRDSGREWIEVLNAGTESIVLSEWSFVENETNHRLSVHQGSDSLASGTYAVIADKPSKFLNDHPGFTGTLYDSAFSLSNSGEALAFKDPQDTVFGTLSYSSAWGAEGNGYSLQLYNGEWVEGVPTPSALSAGPIPKPVSVERDIASAPVVVETEPKEEAKNVVDDIQEESREVDEQASAAAQAYASGTSPFVWIGGLVALILGGVIVVLLARKEQNEEFEIIDDEGR